MKLISFAILIISIFTINEIILLDKVQAFKACQESIDITNSPEILEKINYWTDYFFYLVRPELKIQKETIQLSNPIYVTEKSRINQVVRQVLLCPSYGDKKNHYLWDKDDILTRADRDFWEWFYNALTDAVFYAHHPELEARKSWSKNITLFTEWILIRQSFIPHSAQW